MTQHKKTPAALFPTALPVRLVDGQPRTTSLDIARHFDKRHDHVLRDIRDIVQRLNDPGRLPNFGESSYLNEQGKAQPMYLLNRDAFVFVVGGFTGARADACKWQFIDAFNALEAELAAAQARYAAALDLIAPALRPVAEDARAGLPRWRTSALPSLPRAQPRWLSLATPGCRTGAWWASEITAHNPCEDSATPFLS